MNTNIIQEEINIGVDTGKHQLDIYIRPLDIYFSVSNDDKGIKKAISAIKKYHPTRIIIEATGRLEHEFIFACSKAALVSVAPFNRESGSYKGQRKIKGGRYQIRIAMFMAMMSAIQCNPVFKAEYEQLVADGKPKKIALIACVRKMIVILNSMLRDGVKWELNYAK